MQWTHQPVRRIKPRLSVRGSRGVPGPRLRVILPSPPLAYRPPPPLHAYRPICWLFVEVKPDRLASLKWRFTPDLLLALACW